MEIEEQNDANPLSKWRSHLQFNRLCESSGFIPPSLRLKDPVSNPFSAVLIKKTHKQLLRARINGCLSNIRFLCKSIKGLLYLTAQYIPEAELIELITRTTADIKIREQTIRNRHDKKLSFWAYKYSFPLSPKNEKKEVAANVVNLSSRSLTPSENKLLAKGLKYRIPSKPDIPKIISSIEATIKSYNHQDKCSIRNAVSQAFQKPFTLPPNTHLDLKTLNRLKNAKSIVISRSDKGSNTVVMDKDSYHSKMLLLLQDASNFSPISNQDSVTAVKDFKISLNKLEKSKHITIEDFRSFTSNLCGNAYIYGLPKIHKLSIPLRPIISYHLSPAYPLANTPSFINEITTLHPTPDYIMCSFDVTSMYLSLPHILITDSIHQFLTSINIDPQIVTTITQLSEICLKMNIFTYNREHFKQTKGSPMGSPLSSIAAEIVMTKIDAWINQIHASSISIWRCYIDDVFCICKISQEGTILKDLNNYHPDISFTLEQEHKNVIPFLDTLIIRTPNSFNTTVYYKKNSPPPNYTHFNSYCPIVHKINIVKTLTKRIHTHCSLPIFKTIEK
ncbi:hypothetical protein LAZ67_2001705 [Cordylochernes scorpioides]|uniref:Reverse transcriptase domain-containing protein n=1 Tax=Cordylochernes scorpioides TaxID=51811 RepID=A0ABY6K1Q2_9ARAC|nr:hypothetical protein LAZ67_2001705 [Cordylochernes scorpioides]